MISLELASPSDAARVRRRADELARHEMGLRQGPQIPSRRLLTSVVCHEQPDGEHYEATQAAVAAARAWEGEVATLRVGGDEIARAKLERVHTASYQVFSGGQRVDRYVVVVEVDLGG